MAEPVSVIDGVASAERLDSPNGGAHSASVVLPIRRQTSLGHHYKRIIDVAFSLLLLVLLSPLFAAIAVAVWLSGPGPILYKQYRLALGQRPFVLYKFRTMVDGADGRADEVFHLNQADGPLFKSRVDPRVTPLGRTLRKTFLDELPQLVNVLKGDMSFVGPRPCLPGEAARMDGDVAFRFSVPQGLTGPWQVSGYHFLTFEDQLRVEWEYVNEWSLWKDFLILAKTIPLIVNRSGI